MNDWQIVLYFSLNSAILALTAAGVVVTAIILSTERWNKHFFIRLFAMNMLLLGRVKKRIFES